MDFNETLVSRIDCPVNGYLMFRTAHDSNRQDRDRLDEYHREEFAHGNIPLLIVSEKTWHDREANVMKLLEPYIALATQK